MSYEQMIEENLSFVSQCITPQENLNPGVSRTYYAAYLVAGQFLIDHEITEDKYKTMAGSFGIRSKASYPFDHQTIWPVVNGNMKSKNMKDSFNIELRAGCLRKLRNKAGYTTDMINHQQFNNSVKAAIDILGYLGLKHGIRI